MKPNRFLFLALVVALFFCFSTIVVGSDRVPVPTRQNKIPEPETLKKPKRRIPKGPCCYKAEQNLMKFFEAVNTGMQMNEAGDMLGYKLSKQGCKTIQMNFYVGYDYGPDGCLGISTDKPEALKYVQKIQQIAQAKANQYGVTIVAIGLGKSSPGDWKYFNLCSVSASIPSDNWIIKCIVKKTCN